MIYINASYQNPKNKETIDQAETYKEAKFLISEYRLCMPEHSIWLSQRACKNWK